MALSTFAGGRLWGARYGAGRPWALALPGWGRDHRDFDAVLEGLDAVALDLPGFGVAPEPPAAWSTREYARFIAPVLDDLADGPVVAVGHSFGARVAVHLVTGPAPAEPTSAEPASERKIAALVLTGAPLALAPGSAPSRPALAYRAGRALHRAGLLSSERMEGLRRKHGSEDYRQASEVMRGVLVKAVQETANGTYMPALRQWVSAGGSLELVWGDRDQVASLPGLQAQLTGPPVVHAALTLVPGAGHLITPALAVQLRAALLRSRPQR
jgi:pimeloyl-ACP methyl ester carboxylesterase